MDKCTYGGNEPDCTQTCNERSKHLMEKPNKTLHTIGKTTYVNWSMVDHGMDYTGILKPESDARGIIRMSMGNRPIAGVTQANPSFGLKFPRTNAPACDILAAYD